MPDPTDPLDALQQTDPDLGLAELVLGPLVDPCHGGCGEGYCTCREDR